MALFERGAHFARFVIVRLLGVGRAAEVYEVTEPDGRHRALKVSKPDLPLASKPQARLGQAGEAIASIEHVNVVRFFDADVEAGRVWILLELVDGPDLRQLLRDAGGALPVARAVSIVRQACEGMAAAHARGILHRDLTPENILVGPEDLTKIADFSAAKVAWGGREDDQRSRDHLGPLPGAGVHDAARGGAGERRVLARPRPLRADHRRTPHRPGPRGDHRHREAAHLLRATPAEHPGPGGGKK